MPRYLLLSRLNFMDFTEGYLTGRAAYLEVVTLPPDSVTGQASLVKLVNRGIKSEDRTRVRKVRC